MDAADVWLAEHDPEQKEKNTSTIVGSKKCNSTPNCLFCGEPLVWKSIKMGRLYMWTPYNKDGSRHTWTCTINKKGEKR